MTTFSAGTAIGAGAQVLRRTPWVLLVWALASLVLMTPQIALYAKAAPDLVGFYQAMLRSGAGGPAPDPASMLAFQQHVWALQPVGFLTSIIVNTLLVAAVYRAVLQPEERRWGYLRLGAQELWLGLVALVFMILVWLMMVALVIVVAVTGGFAAAAGKAAGSGIGFGVGLLIALLALGGLGAVIWAALRLSLGLPMSFARRGFLLFESWALTRGHALKLFLVSLAILAVLWIAELLILGGFWGAILGLGGLDFRALLAADPVAVVTRLTPFILGFAPIGAVLGMAVLTFAVAPWADVYRQLTSAGETA